MGSEFELKHENSVKTTKQGSLAAWRPAWNSSTLHQYTNSVNSFLLDFYIDSHRLQNTSYFQLQTTAPLNIKLPVPVSSTITDKTRRWVSKTHAMTSKCYCFHVIYLKIIVQCHNHKYFTIQGTDTWVRLEISFYHIFPIWMPAAHFL